MRLKLEVQFRMALFWCNKSIGDWCKAEGYSYGHIREVLKGKRTPSEHLKSRIMFLIRTTPGGYFADQ